MSKQPLRYCVCALICGLTPLIPAGPVHASNPSRAASVTAAPAIATMQSVRDTAPPVMRQAAEFEATATPSMAAPAQTFSYQTLQARTNPRLFREVFGFAFASSLGDPTIGYPTWNFALLSTVAYFGVHVTWTGDLSSDSALAIWNNPNGPVPGFIQTAHAAGTKVVLTVIMMDSTAGTPNMCSALRRGALTIQRTVSQVVAKGIDGVNIDYESNNTSCTDPSTGAVQSSQSMFTAFMRDMRAALPSGSYLSVDTYSGSAGYRSGSTYYGFYDIGALANYVDSFFVMAYDMEYSNWSAPPLNCSSFCLGPTAPLTTYLFNDSRASNEYRAVVPGSKVIMGIPYYGRKGCVAGTPSNALPNARASSVAADGYLDASTENGYFANSDYHTHREVHDTSGRTRWDTWTSSTARCTREMYWDDVTALGEKYNLIINDRLRGAGIFALNYGGGAPELWSLINLKFGKCSNAEIAADQTSPQIPGTAVTFNGYAFCAGTPEFRFWTQPPGAGWSVLRSYDTASSVTWDTTGKALGTYQFELDARNLGSPVSYDTVARMPMRLALCVTPTLTSDHTSPQLPGTMITFTATVTCRGTPEYRFWVQAPGGSWTVIQDYSSDPTLKWDTSQKAYGNYKVEVDARTVGTSVSYESIQTEPYALTSCISASLTVDKTSPQPTGTNVSLSGSATCVGTPQYRFRIQSPGGPSAVVQDFGSGSAFTWNGAGPDGTYGLEFDAISASAPVSSMSSSQLPYLLVACSAAVLTASPSSPQVPGTTVTLAASSTCPGSPQYRFWVQTPGASWHVVQDFSSASTFSWNTAGLAFGNYGIEVDVRNTGASAGYEATAHGVFTVAGPACTAPTLSSDLPSPQGTGVQVTFTSSTTTCPKPLYRFWIQPPGGKWGIAQNYSSASTFKWPANGVGGTYGVEVDVRDESRPLTYDAVTNLTYVLTACTSATLTTDFASPQAAGAAITLTGTASCPRPHEFRFWVQRPGGSWTVVQAYGSSSTYVWKPSTPGGSYGLEVDVRDLGAAATYETVANLTYAITPPCGKPTLSASPGSSQVVATPVTVTALTSACPTPQYRFWVHPPGGAWSIAQDYGSSGTFSWNTSGLAIGTYQIEADVRGLGSAAAYDATNAVSFTLTSPPCSAPTLTAATGPPAGTGSPVTFTGAAAGCPAPQFRFWVRAPGGSWKIARDYASSPTFTWSGGAAAGSYSFEVDARVLGSSVPYDAVHNITYAVVGCTAASLNAAPASPQAAGTQVILTGGATCLGTAEYRFWVRSPGGSWNVVQAYGSGNTFTWTTTGLVPGTYQLEVDVRNQGASATYETVKNISFVVQ